jgi:arginyl-tRNA synthetase
LYRFEEVALQAAECYAPHHIAHYLLGVVQAFNSWYGDVKVIDENNTELSAHRLAIASAVGVVLKNGLNLLGIETPERM